MAFLTEKMATVLKSPEAKAIVQKLSPVYGEAYTALWIFEVLGREWDDLQKFSEEMLYQVVPQTATWLIPYWEDTYGVTRNENLTLEQRRQNVLNVFRTRGPANPYKLEHMVSSITGCPCELKERTGKNKFTISIIVNKTPENIQMVFSTVQALKPAHLICDIRYRLDSNGNAKIALATTIGVKITLYPWQVHTYENSGTIRSVAAMKSCLSVTVLERS